MFCPCRSGNSKNREIIRWQIDRNLNDEQMPNRRVSTCRAGEEELSMWHDKDVRCHLLFQRDVGAADLDHERRQSLMQPEQRAGDEAECGKSVEPAVRARGDEDHAIRTADRALAQRRDQRPDLCGKLLATAAPRNRAIVGAGGRMAEKSADTVGGLFRKDV